MHRLEKELAELIKSKTDIFDFIERSSLDGIWFWDLENPEHEWMSEAFWRTFGYDPSEKKHLASEWQDMIHPDDLQQAVSNFEKHCADENVPYDQIVRYTHKNGSTVWVRCRGFAIRDKEGKPIRMFGAHTDITEVKKEEQKRLQAERDKNQRLIELQHRYDELVKYAPGVYFQYSIDEQGQSKMQYVTERSEDIWGLTPREIGTDPTPLWEMVHEDDIQGMSDAVEASLESLEAWEYEWRICLPSGEQKWLQGKSTPRRLDDNLTIFDTLVMDVTDQKALQEQLSHREKMEAIGQLAGGVAHDFNNQLAAISGYAELLKMEVISDRAKTYLSNIISSTKRSRDLTGQMLDYSRKQQHKSDNTDVHQELEDTIELLKRAIDKRIVIQKQFNAQLHMVKGDASSLENAFLNIAINAADAMTDGGSFVLSTENVYPTEDKRLSQQSSASATKYLKIVFEDSGIGIAKEYIDKVFDPFFTTKEIGKGTGMGLASVYGVVKQHSGFSYIESKLGKYTRVYVYLPVCEEDVPKPIPNDKEHPVTHPAELTVLVVDDEKMLRDICKDLLSALGYNVMLAANGHEAVEIYRKHHKDIDAVLLDLAMPVMNGNDAYHAIKAINSEVRVVIVSGYDKDSSLQTLNAERISAFIEKPYSLQKLKDTLAEIMA